MRQANLRISLLLTLIIMAAGGQPSRAHAEEGEAVELTESPAFAEDAEPTLLPEDGPVSAEAAPASDPAREAAPPSIETPEPQNSRSAPWLAVELGPRFFTFDQGQPLEPSSAHTSGNAWGLTASYEQRVARPLILGAALDYARYTDLPGESQTGLFTGQAYAHARLFQAKRQWLLLFNAAVGRSSFFFARENQLVLQTFRTQVVNPFVLSPGLSLLYTKQRYSLRLGLEYQLKLTGGGVESLAGYHQLRAQLRGAYTVGANRSITAKLGYVKSTATVREAATADVRAFNGDVDYREWSLALGYTQAI